MQHHIYQMTPKRALIAMLCFLSMKLGCTPVIGSIRIVMIVMYRICLLYTSSHRVLFLNTLAFTICFAAWMINGVLVTFLSTNQVFNWGPVEIGWLLGIPVLTGSIFRLPAGMLTDKFGGKPVFGTLPVSYTHLREPIPICLIQS